MPVEVKSVLLMGVCSELVSFPQVGSILQPVHVEAVHRHRLFLSVNDDSLIDSHLLPAELVADRLVHVLALNDFNSVCIQLLNSGHCPVIVIQVLSPSPLGSLSPIDLFQIVLAYHVFKVLEPK